MCFVCLSFSNREESKSKVGARIKKVLTEEAGWVE